MICEICGAEAWYVCGRNGRPVCPRHSRIEVVSKLSFGSSDGYEVREATGSDMIEIKKLAEYFREGTVFNHLGKEYDITTLPSYVVMANNHFAGALSYSLEGDALVIVLFNVLPGYQGLGAGKSLMETAKEKAIEEGKSTILSAVSNDDLPLIYFYQRNGFQIIGVNTDAVANRHEVQVGFGGIPRRDEICLRWVKPQE